MSEETHTRAAETLLTIKEVAQHLRVSPRTILRWKATGKIKAEPTPGGIVRFKLSSVIADMSHAA